MSAAAVTLPGDGPDGVLLIHGLTGAPSEMGRVARVLHQRGFTVHVPLLAGHGGDKRRLLGTGWRDWLATCEDGFDRLAAKTRAVHVGGVCAGASLAVLLAARRPAASLATYSMIFRYDGWAMPRLGRAAPLLQHVAGWPAVRGISFPERHPFGIKDDRLRAMAVSHMAQPASGMLDSFPIGALRQVFKMGHRVRRIAGQVTAPALLFHAQNDDMADIANSQRLLALLAGPKRLEVLENSYHLLHVDREAAMVARLTADHFVAAGALPQRMPARG